MFPSQIQRRLTKLHENLTVSIYCIWQRVTGFGRRSGQGQGQGRGNNKKRVLANISGTKQDRDTQ